ncbi:MAG TPA: tryptophan synthase subunit alpha [Gemmatimonadales bacterium]|nr:tryptophan synthase subunit alpha [Gemmatimonadales bacterium]
MSEPAPAGLLAACWARLREAGRPGLVAYVTAGHPSPAETAAFLRGAAAAGVDVVELGVPWSDPVADGPTIQASTHAALAGGTTLAGALALLARSERSAPTVVFSYLNPVLALGPARFAREARAAGAAGILITDLPVGADEAIETALGSAGLPLVRLVAPTTPPARQAVIAARSGGFVYLVSRLGVTGEGGSVSASLAPQVASLRTMTRLPVAVGFGISTPAQAAAVARLADGVVIGSAVVARMARGGAAAALEWLRTVRAALDARG